MEKKRSVLKWIVPIILILTAIIAVLVFVIIQIKTPQNNMKTVSKSMLQDVLEISELSTVEYTYNAITRVYDEEEETLRYSVAYEGIVKAGIKSSENLTDDLEIDEKNKEIRITLPEVEIIDYIVDEGSLEYIFEKDEYNTATVSQEAYKICKADLEDRASRETELLPLARENAISMVNGLLEPLKQIYGYEIKVE